MIRIIENAICTNEAQQLIKTKYGLELTDLADWLEKQGEQEQLYIRFGEIPTDEKSKIYQGEIEVGTENGVSVYPAFKTNEGDIVLGLILPITKTTLYTQQHLIEYDDRPCYLVKGDYVGKDTDGQPLINNVNIIEKIDSYRVKDKKQGEQILANSCKTCKDGQESADKVETKFKVGDIVKRKDNPHLTYILKRLTDDGDYEFHAIGKDGNEGCTCFSSVKYQDDWELVEQNHAWSEEDEEMYKKVETAIGSYYAPFSRDAEEMSEWFKSLKDRVQYCISWKPSDEQINALAENAEYVDIGGTQPILKGLLKDLKNLRK